MKRNTSNASSSPPPAKKYSEISHFMKYITYFNRECNLYVEIDECVINIKNEYFKSANKCFF